MEKCIVMLKMMIQIIWIGKQVLVVLLKQENSAQLHLEYKMTQA